MAHGGSANAAGDVNENSAKQQEARISRNLTQLIMQTSQADEDDEDEVNRAKARREKVIPRFFFKGSGKDRLHWDFFIIFLSIYNAFSIPMAIVFSPAQLNTDGMLAFDAIVDFIFIIDIILTFRTTFFDPTIGEEVYDPHRIAKRYIGGGRFFIDFLSSVPLTSIFGDNKILELFGLLKLARIFRVSVVIKRLNVRVEVKIVLRVLNFLLQIIIYMHLLACLWFMVVSVSGQWILNMDFIWYPQDTTYEVHIKEFWR